jgi:hypothetical protein
VIFTLSDIITWFYKPKPHDVETKPILLETYFFGGSSSMSRHYLMTHSWHVHDSWRTSHRLVGNPVDHPHYDENVQILFSFIAAQHCPKLIKLDLSGVSVTNSSLRTLSTGCPKLQSIKLSRCFDAGEKGLWWVFKNCEDLTYINLEEVSKMTGSVSTCNIKNISLQCNKSLRTGYEKISENAYFDLNIFYHETNGTCMIKKCSLRAFQWMVMSKIGAISVSLPWSL